MRKKIITGCLFVAILLSMLLLLLMAACDTEPGAEFVHLNVDAIDSVTDTTFTLLLSNLLSGNQYICAFKIFKYDGTSNQLFNDPSQNQFIIFEDDTPQIDGNTGNWQKEIKKQLIEGHYIAVLSGGTGLIGAWDYKEFDVLNPRHSELACRNVWVNDKGNFQFVFWYPYRDNNWVKIYDTAGKEVFSIDMPYDNPNFEVNLPDGSYTVKTFTVGNTEPIQVFVIGKDANTPRQNLGDLPE